MTRKVADKFIGYSKTNRELSKVNNARKLLKKLKNCNINNTENLMSTQFTPKNQIESKMQNNAEVGNCRHSNILTLPNEMITKILWHMSEYDVLWNVGFTCQRLRAIALQMVKIIDLCEAKLDIARNHFNELLKHNEIVQSIRHIWICSDLENDVREALKLVLKDSNEKHNILVIDYRLFNNRTSLQIGAKFTQLESLLMPKRHRSMKALTNRSIRNIISSCKKLEWLDLRDCTEFDFVSNRNVVSLIGENCKLLECLLLSRCLFTNKSMCMMFQNCNRLEMVILNDCKQLTDQTLITLASNCPLLKLLCIDDCVEISDASISIIAIQCEIIEELSLRNTGVTDESVKAIAINCQEMKVLNLRNCKITSRSLAVIAIYCNKLENLDISNTPETIPLKCLKTIVHNNPELRLHLGFKNVPWARAGSTFYPFGFNWNIESHFRHYNCLHCYPIVKEHAPIIAKEIGINHAKLCLEGFVEDERNIVRQCVLHN